MAVFGLGLVFLLVIDIAKKLSAQDRKAETVSHTRTARPGEQARGGSPTANNDHLKLLMNAIAAQDWGAWNQWRQENPNLTLDFRDVDLTDADLHFANLSDVDLSGANLNNANLNDANLSGANLTGANLTGVCLEGADFTDALVDVSAIKGAKNRAGASVSQIEKYALGLYRSNETKPEQPRGGKAGPPRAGKNA
jgi:hypothetical protein